MTPGASDHDALREQVAAYVLETLPGDERRRVVEHLATCAECAADARSLASVVDTLGRTVPQVNPPPELRSLVLGSIVGADRARAVARVSFDRPHARPVTWVAWLAAAASFVLAVLLGGYAVRVRDQIGSLEARLGEASERSDVSQMQLADVRRRADEAQSAIAVLTASDVTRVDLAGQPVAPAARARAFFSPTRGLVLTGSSLPPLPASRIYQLWVIAGTSPVSAGLIRPDSAGRVEAVLPPPALPGRAAVLAVTIEPEGGVAAPTGDKYLVGTITAP